MIRQFLIVSPRGDCVVVRDFRGDGSAHRNLGDKFFQRVKDTSLAAPGPVMTLDGILYIYLKRSGLYFVLTAGSLDAPLTLWLEMLDSLTRTVKDFCGVLSEATVRRNFPLVYEIVDEVFDYGYPQILTTNDLSNVIRNEPVALDPLQQGYSSAISSQITSISNAGLQHLAQLTGSTTLQPKAAAPRTVPSNASQTPINAQQPSGNDIFIDILDRLSVEMSANGEVMHASLDGLVIMKSYMSTSVPLRMGLNEDLCILNQFVFADEPPHRSGSSARVAIDDCLFHPCADLKDFETDRSLTFTPPQGEFILVRFRSQQPNPSAHTDKGMGFGSPGSGLDVPLRVQCGLRILAPDKVEICAIMRSTSPAKAVNGLASMQCTLPKWISGGSHDAIGSLIPQTVEIRAGEHKLLWSAKRLPSQSVTDIGFRARLAVDLASAPRVVERALRLATAGSSAARGDAAEEAFATAVLPRQSLHAEEVLARYFGPISVNFELPMHSASKLQIRYLRLAQSGFAVEPPRRWVRYATQSTSFTVRFT